MDTEIRDKVLSIQTLPTLTSAEEFRKDTGLVRDPELTAMEAALEDYQTVCRRFESLTADLSSQLDRYQAALLAAREAIEDLKKVTAERAARTDYQTPEYKQLVEKELLADQRRHDLTTKAVNGQTVISDGISRAMSQLPHVQQAFDKVDQTLSAAEAKQIEQVGMLRLRGQVNVARAVLRAAGRRISAASTAMLIGGLKLADAPSQPQPSPLQSAPVADSSEQPQQRVARSRAESPVQTESVRTVSR
jgi:chromosome segregation ATPase